MEVDIVKHVRIFCFYFLFEDFPYTLMIQDFNFICKP